MNNNDILLIGNIGKDPTIKQTQNGNTRAAFQLATSRYIGQGQERQRVADWHNVVAWGTLANEIAANLSKGRRVIVSGELRTDTIKDAEGNNKYFTYVLARDVGIALNTFEQKATQQQPQAKANWAQFGTAYNEPTQYAQEEIPF